MRFNLRLDPLVIAYCDPIPSFDESKAKYRPAQNNVRDDHHFANPVLE